MKNVFNQEYSSRLEEVEEDRREIEQVVVEHKDVFIGNAHSVRPRNGEDWHEWRLFVRMRDEDNIEDYIDKVVVKLHPTFTPSTVVLSDPPFEMKRLGWGVFNIKVTLHFKQEYNKKNLHTSHYLCFDGDGDFATHSIEFVRKTFK
ncbi:YEATS family protein [Acrasis kona]|uniref:YEATS family protein n=1 Tax=Acrasis kona TaxID=1008807 RepID=A0AAW2ZD64_9EUKA